jgi:hypothetical protein
MPPQLSAARDSQRYLSEFYFQRSARAALRFSMAGKAKPGAIARTGLRRVTFRR